MTTWTVETEFRCARKGEAFISLDFGFPQVYEIWEAV